MSQVCFSLVALEMIDSLPIRTGSLMAFSASQVSVWFGEWFAGEIQTWVGLSQWVQFMLLWAAQFRPP